MKEIRDIIHAYDTLDKTTVALALATVIDVKGSSYRRTGARMLIQENGFWTGGISGGCIEGNALKKANLAILENKARVVTYDTENDDESQIGVSLGCNGVISVLISPIDPSATENQIEQLRAIDDLRDTAILITVVNSNLPIFIPGEVFNKTDLSSKTESLNDDILLRMQEDIDKVESSSKSALINYGTELTLFIEFIPPSIQLVIAGGNYDILPLLDHSRNLGWKNVVINNPRKLNSSIKDLCEDIRENFEDFNLDAYTVIMLMSHDYKADLNNLKKALSRDFQYIGLLGPASRKEDMFRDLGIDSDTIKNRIFGPAGLDIGARQPEEIAIAVLAEIIAVLRDRPGNSLRLRTTSINDRV